VDKETDIGVYHKGQWVDSSICKHLIQIKNSNYAIDQKERICEGITDTKAVAWKVAFTITHKPKFKDDTNDRTIHKLRTKCSQLNQHIKNSWRGRCWDETEQESLTTCPLCTSTNKKVEERPAHFLRESKALEKVQEEALLRITNNLDQHFTPFTNIHTWIGDDCHQKAAVLLGLPPKEWEGGRKSECECHPLE